MEVKKEPLSADGSEEYTLNHRKNSERPVQVKEERMSSSSSCEVDGEEEWRNSDFSFDTCELADELIASMSFHFNIKIAQLALVVTSEDFFTNLRAS